MRISHKVVYGVRVTTLCPGSVASQFQARAGIGPGLEHEILKLSARDVARQGYRGLMANKRVVLPGLGMKIIPLLLRLFPRGTILAAVGRVQLRQRATPMLLAEKTWVRPQRKSA